MADAIVTLKLTPREFNVVIDALDAQATEFKANQQAATNPRVVRGWKEKYEEVARIRQRLNG